ncbi:MAG TPA: dihydroorotate dehydrogenase electron transfer subunit [Pirellulales bacterium]|jgi:dihydroorotate dehydrogenase electron transfer subunit|nr:dihydroorotate dehydrogenase electron transfer subunit [Pirellulales bacterium]
MTLPSDEACYADHAAVEQVTLVENLRLARDTFRLRFNAAAIARRIVPGQFLMIRLAAGSDPLLARPLALYDTVLDARGKPIGIDVVYLVVGKLTGALARLSPGDKLTVWGPLGNGFSHRPTEHLLMVAGGIGQTPFLALARAYLQQRRYGESAPAPPRAKRVTLCYGARSSDYLAGIDDFSDLGVDVRVSTDDGSAGHHGLVTELVEPLLAESPAVHVVCCGPERMMHAVAEQCARRQVSCEVSLETPMACGLGICFSCVTRLRDETGEWDYRRTCVEGPVFDATRIVW